MTGRPCGTGRWGPALVAGLLLAVVLALVAPAAVVASPPTGPLVVPADESGVDPFGEQTPVLVVMDTSGSMEELASSDGRRIDIARSSMLDLVGALAPRQPYGLVAYPGGPENAQGCTTGTVETPVRALDRVAASAAIRRLSPDGDTPSGPALRHARDLLEEAGYLHGTIVLVSDGEANCGTGPCEVAKQIRRSGFDVVINTVGFEVEGRAEAELGCVADATGGRYVGVDDEDGLTDAITGGATAHLAATVDAPEELSVVTGGTPEAGAFGVRVVSDGRFPAHDVRVTLTVAAGGSLSGTGVSHGVLVPQPVRFLGNLAPAAERSVQIATRPDEAYETVTWVVTVTAENALPVRLTGTLGVEDHLSTDDLGPLFDGIERIAVVGDSYSAGEGAGLYEEDGTKCHRSTSTYAARIWDDVTIIACSGAVTSDFFRSQTSGDVKVVPQLLKLRAEAVSEDSPQAVFVSIGGNDAGFGDVVKRCVAYSHCGFLSADHTSTSLSGMLAAGNAVQGDVVRVLRSIDAAVNDQQALDRRDGQVAPIVLLPYPQIIPQADVSVSGCMLGVSQAELGDLNQFLGAINASVSLATYRLRNRGRPVYVVPQVEQAFLPDHTICEGERSYATYTSLDRIAQGVLPADTQELLHPNADGYEAMARAVVAWSATRAARPIELSATPVYAVTQQDVERPSWWQTWAETTLQTVVRPVAEASADLTIEQDGFEAGSVVVIRLDSASTNLGTAVADADGRVRATVRVPRWVPAGEHHVRFIGAGPDGETTLLSQEVTIHSRGTRAWWLLGTLGLVLVAGARVRLRSIRRRVGAAAPPVETAVATP